MDDDRLTDAVIRTVAAHANERPQDLPPLNGAIDPDALEAIFGPRTDGSPRESDGRVTFEYAGFVVSVDSSGEVDVKPIDENTD